MDHWLSRAAALHPERAAIEHESGTTISFAQLLADASAAARWLAADGIRPGDRLPLEDSDRLRFAVSLHAALISGATAVPIDSRLAPAERERRSATVQPNQPKESSAGTATLMYTSGTTSSPKEVALSASNWQANAVGSALALGLDPNERWLCTMPLGHVGGLSILLRSTLYATTVVLHERFDVEAVLAELMNPERRITLISVVPTMLRRLLDAGLANPPTLRWALISGAPTSAALLERAAQAGVPVAPSYGLTETCSQMVTFGLPLLGGELRLGGEGAKEEEILVRGPMVASGALEADGWLHTGDLGRLDPAGRLQIVGRSSETIVSGGENVAPAEVEAILVEHPAVAEAAVFGVADPEWGERVVAQVVLRDGETAPGAELESRLREFVGARLARFKVPKQIKFVGELPHTYSGKLARSSLR